MNGFNNEETRIIVVLSQDKPGVLTRIASLIRRRGCNIESLTVGSCEAEGFSRFTILVTGMQDNGNANSIATQINNLIDVVVAEDITEQNVLTRELVLVKVHPVAGHEGEIIDVIALLHGTVIDTTKGRLIIQFVGNSTEITNFLQALWALPCNVEVVKRSGGIAMIRGSTPTEFATPQLS